MTEQTYCEIVRDIFSKTLGVPASQIKDDSDLFEMGGDSMVIIQIVARINQQPEIRITPKDLFVSPTVAGLSRVIQDMKVK